MVHIVHRASGVGYRASEGILGSHVVHRGHVGRRSITGRPFYYTHYSRLFCLCAIQQDEAEEQDIYNIDILEVMKLAERAWKIVSPSTIKNSWNHTDRKSVV